MKKIIGFISIAILLSAVILWVFVIWNIAPINWKLIKQIAITATLIGGMFLCTWLFFGYFFSEEPYDKTKGKVAHPKRDSN